MMDVGQRVVHTHEATSHNIRDIFCLSVFGFVTLYLLSELTLSSFVPNFICRYEMKGGPTNYITMLLVFFGIGGWGP